MIEEYLVTLTVVFFVSALITMALIPRDVWRMLIWLAALVGFGGTAAVTGWIVLMHHLGGGAL